jgi:hypothetical protein
MERLWMAQAKQDMEMKNTMGFKQQEDRQG